MRGTQEGFTGTPLIELNGAAAGAVPGLTLGGTGGSTVRGFVINRFTGGGVVVSPNSNGNTISGNWIGVSNTGAAAAANIGDGISLHSNGNLVSGNVISGNQGDGIEIESGRSGNRIIGNYIGLNVAGTGALGNSGVGVNVFGNANTIGGAGAGEGNVISSNFSGVEVSGTQAIGNLVQGNYIGTDVSGTLDRGNLSDGVRISGGARNNIVGGTTPNDRNVISGNNSDGVEIKDSGTAGNVVQGNLIGTRSDGTLALANGASGVAVTGSGNTIGGTAGGAGNLISGNTDNGILFSGAGATANVVLGNTVGLNAVGSLLGNGVSGVLLTGGAGGNTIGGTAPGARNVLSGNGQDGITGFASNGNLIQGNYIGTNAGGTIDLGNAEDGIYFQDSSNNVVGGTSPGAANVLSGNGWTGVTFWATGAGNVVQGNSVGTDPGGTLNSATGRPAC